MSLIPWWAGAVLVLLLVGGALVVVAARARRAETGGAVVVRTTFAIAAITASAAAVGALVTGLAVLLLPHVPITVPVREYWPTLPEGTWVDGTTAVRAGGGFTRADIEVTGLSLGARACWAVSQALAWLVPGAVAGLVAVACARLRDGRPFAPLVARATMVVATIVALGGTASAILGDVAGSMASHELLQWTSMASSTGDPAGVLPAPTMSVTLPFWPVGAGLGLAALATILRRGHALQRDAEGLV